MIASLGQLVADVVVKPVEKHPKAGTADRVDIIDLRTGGCGLNTATVLQKLGVEAAAMGKVGRDVFGEFLLKTIQERGLNAEGVVLDPNTRTSSVIVMISRSGERSFLYCPGGNEALTIDDVNFELIKRSQILHFGGIMKLESLDLREFARRVKESGATVSIDTDWDTRGRWLEWIEPCLAYADIFLPSVDEAKMLSKRNEVEEIADFFLNYGIKIVVIKMGRDGCSIRTPDVRLTVPAYEVKVADASGAGDAFVAGFLTGYYKGWDLERAGELANACGALCVTEVGTSEGIRTLDETLAFMEVTPRVKSHGG